MASDRENEIRSLRDQIVEMEVASVRQDAADTTVWVVEVTDPTIRPDEYGYRHLVGPFERETQALAEADVYETQCNPMLRRGGELPVQVEVRPVLRSSRTAR